MIIDSHTHLNKSSNDINFSNGVKTMIIDAKKNSIKKVVVIANTISGTDCASTKEILSSISDDSFFYVIGSPNITSKNPNIKYFDNLLKSKRIIGLKLFPGHERFYPTDNICEPVYQLALKHTCPVVIHTGINSDDYFCAKYNDPKYIVDITKKYPDLKIIIAHYFWPKMDYCFELTKNIQNIYYDTSAMADPEVIELTGGVKKVKEILENTVSVKPKNVIFGSDYDACDQKFHLDLIDRLNISNKLKVDILSQNFLKCFKNMLE